MQYAFLAILVERPAHGYEIKQALESAFGPLWPPFNFGQIYTTLSRLERDGYIKGQEVSQEGRPDKKVYALTPSGRQALINWTEAATTGPRLKDEFFMKLVLARLSGIADTNGLIVRQRREYLQAMKDLDGLNARQPIDGDPAAALLVEGAILHLQADLKWLDLCEERFAARKA